MIEIVSPGPLATIQDLGRPGYAALGVPPSGAADRAALVRANRWVGNPDGAAGIEATFGGLHVRALAPVVVAVSGAPCAAVMDAPFLLGAGEELRLRTPKVGVRTYVAFRGGLEVAADLGSRSTDVLSGLGPAPLRPGDVLPIGSVPAGLGPRECASTVDDAAEPPTYSDPIVLRASPGPRLDWFADEAWSLLTSSAYTVGVDSNRIALRLHGPAVPRRASHTPRAELPSEGLVVGAVQVPPSGEPIVFLADHPVTGGYPVIAVVGDVGPAAQARPGAAIRIEAC